MDLCIAVVISHFDDITSTKHVLSYYAFNVLEIVLRRSKDICALRWDDFPDHHVSFTSIKNAAIEQRHTRKSLVCNSMCSQADLVDIFFSGIESQTQGKSATQANFLPLGAQHSKTEVESSEPNQLSKGAHERLFMWTHLLLRRYLQHIHGKQTI